MGAHEVVVPDTLGDANDTIAKGLAFSRHTRSGYRYMMVAQGKNAAECIQTVEFVVSDLKFAYVTTIGIPRLINNGDRHGRFKVASYIKERGLDVAMEYHFLGAHRHLDEVGYLDQVGVGRGIDTSAPIYMGMKGRTILKGSYINRPNDYFVMSTDRDEVGLNIKTYLDWANYDYSAELPEKASSR